MTGLAEHFGQAVSVKGLSGVGRGGLQRHIKDTERTLCLTLYGQDGVLQELTVPRSRDTELFQEWLRRFDRYTPKEPTQ